ncbi:PAS domain S-box protein [Desulfovibrio inopinatus]|uniref:PAS domain S-box protein n=1 Tax=Desulfovibrio inopinatus TaxID=102109 RepID=UPI0003FF28D2|nr:PAS domain S-box protein [Desulfovibrio inopinatus]
MTEYSISSQEEKVPCIHVNHRGIITDVNPAFCTTFHWNAEDLLGASLTTIIPEKLRDAHHLGFSRYLETQIPTLLGESLALDIKAGDGHILAAIHRIEREPDSFPPRFVAYITPLSEKESLA